MTNIKLIVNGSKVRAEVDGVLTSGSIGIPVTIDYDSSWDGLTKHLVCTSGKWGPTGKRRTMLNVDTASTVPHEVMIAEEHLYIGIEGRSANGPQVVRTVLVDCGTIFPGADANADASVKPTLPAWAQMQQQIDALTNIINGFTANGLPSSKQAEALDGMLRACVYKEADTSNKYAAFRTAFGITAPGNSNGGNGPSGDGNNGEIVTTYTVTNTLTNVTNSNTATTVNSGDGYMATLTIPDGYEFEITVTMGGVDITESVFGDMAISIYGVTGDIVITAIASAPAPIYELAEPWTPDGTDIGTGFCFGSNDPAITSDWTIVIACTPTAFNYGVSPCVAESDAGTAFKIYYNGAGNRMVYIGAQANIQSIGAASKNVEDRIVITHKAKSKGSLSAYAAVDGAVTSYTWTSNADLVKEGAELVMSGTFPGTINDFVIHKRIFSDGEINAYLGVE